MPIKHCIACDQEIIKSSWQELFRNPYLLCENCRNKLAGKWRHFQKEGVTIHYLFDYQESYFQELLLRYKEAGDEALKDIFLDQFQDFLRWRYRRHFLVIPPSSQQKKQQRGFVPMQQISQCLGLPIKKILLKEERTQEGKSRIEREKMRQNFLLEDAVNGQEKILIMDDVFTSGATVLGIYDLFRGKVKKIEIVVLAYSHKKKSKEAIFLSRKGYDIIN